MQAYAEGFDLFDASRLRARQREDRAPLDAGLGRALLAVRAGRAGLRAGGQRPRRPQPLRRGLRRGPLDGRGRDRPRASRRRSSPRRCYERFYTARQRRVHRPRSTPRCARSSAATRRASRPTDDDDAGPAGRQPARRGARAPAGPPHDARHLRRDRRPRQAQAAARRSTTSPTRARCPSASTLVGDVALGDGRRGVPRDGDEAIREFSRRTPDEIVLDEAAGGRPLRQRLVRRRRGLRRGSAARWTSSTSDAGPALNRASTSRRRRSSSP